MGMAAMLGTGRNQLSRGLLRQVAKVRDVRTLASVSLSREAARQATSRAKPAFGLETGSIYRSIYTTRVLGDEVKIIVCPAFADSISEGDIRWEKAVGDTVAEDEVICEIETDKTSVPVPSPTSGVIEELLVEDGSTVAPGAKLLKLKVGPAGAAAPKPVAAAAPEPVAAAAPPPPPPPPPPKPAAPMASRPPPAPLPPRPMAGAAPVVRLPPADPTKEIAGTRSEHRVKMNRMRLKIASRLKEAQNTNAMLTTFNELDMSNIMQLRKENQDAFVKKHGIKMGFMSAFVKASAYALTEAPTVNAVIEGQEVIYRDFVDISVAVATPKGLVVPVLRNCQDMSYADVEKGIAALGQKAKNNDISIEDMDGGTFTICHSRHARCVREACSQERSSRDPPYDVHRSHL